MWIKLTALPLLALAALAHAASRTADRTTHISTPFPTSCHAARKKDPAESARKEQRVASIAPGHSCAGGGRLYRPTCRGAALASFGLSGVRGQTDGALSPARKHHLIGARTQTPGEEAPCAARNLICSQVTQRLVPTGPTQTGRDVTDHGA